MRDRYNLNLLPGMSEDGVEYGEQRHSDDRPASLDSSRSTNLLFCRAVSDDVDLNNVASIPGMGIPDQLKAAMEQEHSSKSSRLASTQTRFFQIVVPPTPPVVQSWTISSHIIGASS